MNLGRTIYSILTLHIRRRTFLLFAFLLLSVFAFSQSDSVNQNNGIVIKLTPTALLGSPSALQFAAEFFYKKKYSFQIEYGIMFPEISLRNHFDRGHRIRIENRFYTKKRRWYFAPEIHALYKKYNTSKRFSNNWVTDSLSGNKYAVDSYKATVGVKKIIIGVNGKIGFQYIFKKPKIVLDVYVGLGMRYVNTIFTSYPTTGEYVTPKDNWLEPPFKEGNRVGPDAIVGFKIGYQIY